MTEEERFQHIIKGIEEGNSLRAMLREEGMPSSSTFYEWIDEDKEMAKHYARACEYRAEKVFEEILEIADDQEDDIYTDQDGKEQTNHNVIQRARLRVDARKWALSKMNPRKYGDKIETKNEHTGEITIVRRVKK